MFITSPRVNSSATSMQSYLSGANEDHSKVQYHVLHVNINVNKFKQAFKDDKTQDGAVICEQCDHRCGQGVTSLPLI